jgi:hypothetical protein
MPVPTIEDHEAGSAGPFGGTQIEHEKHMTKGNVTGRRGRPPE